MGAPVNPELLASAEGDLAFGFYFDSTIHLIGVAYCGYPYVGYGIYWDNYTYDTVVVTVYTPSGENMYPSSIAVVDNADQSLCKRIYWINVSEHEQLAFPGYIIPVGSSPIYEVYFDEEIDIHDSLYISVREWEPYNQHWGYTIHGWVEGHTLGDATNGRIFPRQSYRVRNVVGGPWIYGEQNSYPLLFPIIRRDCDTCPTVQGLQVFRSSATQSFFRWQRGEGHRDWQLSYGPVGTAPDDGTIIDFSNPISSIIDFSPDTQYVAYVRARCLFARYEYGPWSAPVYVDLGSGSIDAAEAEQFTLSPNPAAGQVTVSASQGIKQIEVYDTRGAKIYSQTMATDRWTLTTEEWPAGQYIVTVETAAGTTSKVLIIER